MNNKSIISESVKVKEERTSNGVKLKKERKTKSESNLRSTFNSLKLSHNKQSLSKSDTHNDRLKSSTSSSSSSNKAIPNALLITLHSIKDGHIPPNSNLQDSIYSTQVALDEVSKEVKNPKGILLIDDSRQVLDSLSRLIQYKNADEKIQRLLNTTAQTYKETKNEFHEHGDKDRNRNSERENKDNRRQFLKNGKLLTFFAIRSNLFRDSLSEFLELSQNLIMRSNLDQKVEIQEISDKFKEILLILSSRSEYFTFVNSLFSIIHEMSVMIHSSKPKLSEDKISLKSEINPQDQISTENSEENSEENSFQSFFLKRYGILWKELKIVLEEFLGHQSLDLLERKLYELIDVMKEDSEAQSYFRQFRQYVLESIENPKKLKTDESNNTTQYLIEKGQEFLGGKYKLYFQDLITFIRSMLSNMKQDAATNDLSSKIRKLGADFVFNSTGKLDLLVIQDSVEQIKSVIVPVLTKALSQLVVPKVTGANAKYKYSLDGIVLHIEDLLPHYLDLSARIGTRMNINQLTTRNNIKLKLEISKMKISFSNIHFEYERLKFPKLKDTGVATIDLSQGQGIALTIEWKIGTTPNPSSTPTSTLIKENKHRHRPYNIILSKVECKVSQLKITTKSNNHNLINKMVTRVFTEKIKKQIEKAIEKNISGSLNSINDRLNDLLHTQPLFKMTGSISKSIRGVMNSETNNSNYNLRHNSKFNIQHQYLYQNRNVNNNSMSSDSLLTRKDFMPPLFTTSMSPSVEHSHSQSSQSPFPFHHFGQSIQSPYQTISQSQSQQLQQSILQSQIQQQPQLQSRPQSQQFNEIKTITTATDSFHDTTPTFINST